MTARYKLLFNSWKEVVSSLLLDKEYDLTNRNRETNISHLCTIIYNFRVQALVMFGGTIVTNYFHIVTSNHVIEMIRLYGPLAIYSGVGFECLVGKTRSFIQLRTNRGGHQGGKLEKASKGSHATNISRWMLRRLSSQLCSISSKSENNIYTIDDMRSKGLAVNMITR